MSYIPNNITDCLDFASISLEKGLLVLGELTDEYDFSERPIVELNTANSEAEKLIYDYHRIITFIQIANDYVFNTKELIEKAQQLNDNRRKVNAST